MRSWSTERRGYTPPFFLSGRIMSNKTLSVFIDESGDFGKFDPKSPYYYVSMVLHDQSVDISSDIMITGRVILPKLLHLFLLHYLIMLN